MPVQENVLDRLANSDLASNCRTPSPAFPVVSPCTTGVYSTFTSINYISTSHSMDNQTSATTSFSPTAEAEATTFDNTASSSDGNQGMGDQMKIETSPASSYYATSPYYSPTSASYSPSSYRESSHTPLSSLLESAPEAIFLPAEQQQQQQHCFSNETSTATCTGSPSQEGHTKERDTPPHQPLSMLSSVASLLPSHQQHANQGSNSIVVPTMIHTPRLRPQRPMHPPQSICLSQSWDTSTHSYHNFTPTPIPAPTPAPTPMSTHSPHLHYPGLMAVPLHSSFSWPIPLAMPNPAPASSPLFQNQYSSSSCSHPFVASNVRTLSSNAPPLSSNSSYSSRSAPISPSALSPSSDSMSSSSRGFPMSSTNHSFASSPLILPSNVPARASISPPSISLLAEQQLHRIYQLHHQRSYSRSPLFKREHSISPPFNRQAVPFMIPSDAGPPFVDVVNDRASSAETNVDMHLSSDYDDVKLEDPEQEERVFLEAIEAAQERFNQNPSRRRVRGPNAGVRRTTAELDCEEFADRGLARILVYADDNLRDLVSLQKVPIREPHVYDADLMDLYCLFRGDNVQGRHLHTGDICLKNRMGCRVALAVRYAYQSDLMETHLLWVDRIDRKDIPISIIMSFPACGNLIMRALKDDVHMGAQYRALCKQGYSDPPKTSPREYGKIASLNRISWSIAYQNQRHMSTQAMGFLQRASQAYQGAMGQPSRGMLKKRKMRAVARQSSVPASAWQ